MHDIISDLNPNQQQAVTHIGTPVLVLAGAGSGKTKALTHRTAWLINQKNIPSGNILLLTFTNKAAGEMLNRVKDLIGNQDLPFAGTFHKFCALLLRKHGHHVGVPAGYVIYDDDDQVSIMKSIIRDYGLDSKRYKPESVLYQISYAKNDLITPKMLAEKALNQYQEIIAKLYRDYQNLLRKNEAVDFDDILSLAVTVLKEQPSLLTHYANQYQHVLVDEYQDTNTAQYELTKLISSQWRNLMVVGDFSQAIYSWRGADFRNLELLAKDFPDLTTIKLEQNYRSTQNILNAASKVISYNKSHPVLDLWTKSHQGELITFYQASDEVSESQYISDTIKHHVLLGGQYKDFVVMYRTNAQSRAVEESLLREGLPYMLIGGVRFYSRKEIKDLLAYLRLVRNPTDSISRERAEKVGKRRLAMFDTWRESWSDIFDNLSTMDILEAILTSTGYLSIYDPNDPDDVSRLENIQELKSVAAKYPKLDEFLENVALVELEAVKNMNDQDKITLMTLHAAKGLEFKNVFMIGLEEGLFPHSRALTDPNQMEEERRLCYVGITRAREKLYLTYTARRYYFGRRESFAPSRFLREIPEHLINQETDPLLIGESTMHKKLYELDSLDFSGIKNDNWY